MRLTQRARGLFLGAAVVLATTTIPRPAAAFQYEVFLDVEEEDDIWDLFNQGVIDEDTRDSLLEILIRGIDLNSAGRGELYALPNLTYRDVDAILEYREEAGRITNPVQLVAAGVLSEEKLLGIAAFLRLPDVDVGIGVDGFVRYQTRWVAGDERGAPPMALQSRIFTLKNLRLGFAGVLTQSRPGAPVYDPNRENALVADGFETRFETPKIYGMWDDGNVQVLAGSYQAGFGQRLTFDNSIQFEPNGIYPDDRLFRNNRTITLCRESAGELDGSPCGADDDSYGTPDFRWRETLFGVAGGVRKLEVGTGELQVYGFSSYQRKSIYQYQLYNPEMCEDPRLGTDACDAPDVFVHRDNPLEPTSRFKFTTLPDMYAEATGGGNATYRFSRRSSIGVTGYGSDVNFLTEGIELDFQEWARTPFGGPFGAVGVNGSYGKGVVDVFAEVTRSFDSMPDGGGDYGAIVRTVTTVDKNELEVTARYYGEGFANPYARPISGPDQFEGLRARDEAGGRVRYTGLFGKRWNLRANVDVWTRPGELDPQAFMYVRSDLNVTDQYRWGVWAEYRRSNLDGFNCRIFLGSDFELSDEFGNPLICRIDRGALTGRFRYQPDKKYWFDLQYRHNYYDGGRQDLSATAIAAAKLSDRLRVRGRGRWNWDDIKDNERFENSVWFYADLTYRLRARDRLQLRYDYFRFIDDRSSTLDRSPNPEHWLWLQYEAKF